MRVRAQRPRRVLHLLVALLAAMVVWPTLAGSKATPTVKAVNGPSYLGEKHEWVPAQVSVNAGGVVAIENATTVAHGVEWRTGPTTPGCSAGVPVGTTPAVSGTRWRGTCMFAQPGSYTFWCTVHRSAMSGSVTVNAIAPTVKRVSPSKGPMGGGTTVTIAGANFTGATAVKFGAIAATSFEVTSPTSITAVSPAEAKATVIVSVTTPSGTSATSRKGHFKYVR
jgi:plastocyanin